MTLYTIGHSTRARDEFLKILQAHGIERLVDVRHFPGSRKFPHFGKQAMQEWLAEAGIDYVHEVDLGGRRKPNAESPNIYWRHPQFRSYADWMDAPAFRAALARVVQAAERPSALMCSEAVPWRCHRQLIADLLVAQGQAVFDIFSAAPAKPHLLNPQARLLANGRLVYDQHLDDDAAARDQRQLFPDSGPPEQPAN